MRFTITEMSLGDILSRGMSLLLSRFPVFMAIEFLVVIPTLVLQLEPVIDFGILLLPPVG
jgi:hypothetical protein